jgi:AraC-like DNA-binding protein
LPRTILTKCHIALDGCSISRPDGLDDAVEIVVADVRLRSFPARLSPGLGICLKIGPSHLPSADGRPTPIPADAVIVRPPGCVWSSPALLSGFVAIDIDPCILPAEGRYGPMAALSPHTLPSVPRLVAALANAESKLHREQAIAEMLEALFRIGWARSAEVSEPVPTRAVRRARDYLLCNFESNPSLSEVARQAGANKFVLTRAFRQAFGIAPHQFLVQLRLQRARSLLAAGAAIPEAAAHSGFADQSHLGRHFKRHLGVTPAVYSQQVSRSLAR